MQDGSRIHYEPGRVIIDTPNGPISMIDPVLGGNLTALLAALAFAALIGLLASEASRKDPVRTGPGAIGAPGTLLLVAVLSLIFSTFRSHLAAAVIGGGDPIPFVILNVIADSLGLLGFILAFLAVCWLFVTVNVFTSYSRTARFVIQAFFLMVIWQWLGVTNSWSEFITSGKLVPSKSFAVIIQVVGTALPFALGYIVRLLLRRLRWQDLLDTQLALIPTVAITGACVAVYLAGGFAVLWEILSKPVFHVNLMRELEPATFWLISCLPVYLVLILCQIAVPAIRPRTSTGHGHKNGSEQPQQA